MNLTTLRAGLLMVVLSGVPQAAEIVQLRDGTLVHGEIVRFDESSGITIERADNGGVVSLGWEHLPAAEVQRIKASRGFTGEETQLYTVPVTHLILRNGTTETGLRVEAERSDVISLRRRGQVDSFPKSQIAALETGRVEGRAVLTPDELYLRLTDAVGEAVDAAGHFQLALACEGAGLLELAREHYLTARELDGRLKVELLAAKLAWLQIKIEDAAETAALDEIRHRLYRRQYELCAEMAAAFRVDYPESRQLGDLIELEADIERRKREYRGKGITSAYFALLDRRITRLARDLELSLDVARELIETVVHEEIMVSLGEDYQMSPETVQELWGERRGGSVRSFAYGTGTFILGQAKALEFGRFDDNDEPDGSADEDEIEEDFDDLVERVKRQRQQQAARRQSARRGSGVLDDEGPSPDEWWQQQSAEDRQRWLLAYYAEASGQLRVLEARPRDCRRCDARGYIEGTNVDDEVIRITCPVCKGLKFERLVRCR